jgi:hypothetical protein
VSAVASGDLARRTKLSTLGCPENQPTLGGVSFWSRTRRTITEGRPPPNKELLLSA